MICAPGPLPPAQARWVAASILLCTMWTQAAFAATVLTAEVQENDGAYLMTFEAIIGAPYDRVHALLTDYEHLPRYNRHLREIAVLGGSLSDVLLMRVVSRPCVLVFCKTVVHVQRVEEQPPGNIRATVVPELSDLKQGFMHWRLLSQGPRTLLAFEGNLSPAFWVPPMVGPAMIKYSLRREAIELVVNLEAAAARP
jgi:hypothetical protein